MKMKHRSYLLLLLSLLYIQSCSTSYKYSYGDAGPCFEGDFCLAREKSKDQSFSKTIKVVSFNIETASNIDKAINLLRSKELIETDVLLLQEMDETGSEKIAKALNMAYIYYPAIYHPKLQKNIGNAILTRWDIVGSEKIQLPYPAIHPDPIDVKNYIHGKTATSVDVAVGDKIVTFVSAHAAVMNTTKRRQEISQFLVDVTNHQLSDHVVIAGDFNSLGSADIEAIAIPFVSNDYIWASKEIGPTVSEKKYILKVVPDNAFQLDHIFVKGLQVGEVGKVYQKGVSDHLPIWAELEI